MRAGWQLPGWRRRTRAARGVLLVGGIWLALHVGGLLGPASQATFLLLAVLAVVAAVVGVRRWRPEPAWPWGVIIGALVLFLVSGIVRQSLGTLGDLSSERSLLPDLLALVGYVGVGVGLMGLHRARRRGRGADLDAILDATVAALAVLTVAWVYLIDPALSQQDVALQLRLLLALYPPMSVFLVAIGLRMTFVPGSRSPFAFRVVMAALVAMLAGDLLFMLVDVGVADPPQHLVELPYALAYLFLSAAVLHPTMRDVTTPLELEEMSPRAGRLAFVAVALAVPAAVVLTRTDPHLAERLVLASIVLALTAAAAWRVHRALRAHARSEARLAHRATHDMLTDLPNRAMVRRRVDVRTAVGGDGGLVALMFLDLDRFKLVNDTLGHATGDELLRAVAGRLRSSTRNEDLVGHVGGDEFVVVADGVTDPSHATELAERVRLTLGPPFAVGDAEISVTASVGVALGSAGEEEMSGRLLREADTAMYRAKDAGGDAVALFDGSMREHVARRVELEGHLRHAIERDELEVHYQPIVRVADGRVTGLEALLRWNHPDMGPVPPTDFVPVAEDTGLIVGIGEWVIDQACAHVEQLRRELPHADDLWVAVNVSTRQLREDAILDHVARALVRHQLPASALRLELTESEVMESVASVSKRLGALRDCGVQIAVDDFGTGYSSLAYLRELPVDEVKIDRSFVSDLGGDRASASLVSAVVAIAGSLGISTVAEGVETAGQARRLRELGCAEAQGYHYSRPVPFAQVASVLALLGLAGEPRLRAVPSVPQPASAIPALRSYRPQSGAEIASSSP